MRDRPRFFRASCRVLWITWGLSVRVNCAGTYLALLRLIWRSIHLTLGRLVAFMDRLS